MTIDGTSRLRHQKIDEGGAERAAVAYDASMGVSDGIAIRGGRLVDTTAEGQHLERLGKASREIEPQVVKKHGRIGPPVQQRVRCLPVMNAPTIDDLQPFQAPGR